MNPIVPLVIWGPPKLISGVSEDKPAVSLPSLLHCPSHALPGIQEPFSLKGPFPSHLSSPLFAYCLLPIPGELVLFKWGGRGKSVEEERREIKDSVLDMRRREIWKEAEVRGKQ